MLKVLPRLELGLEDSKSSVITNYTIRPLVYLFIFFLLIFPHIVILFKKALGETRTRNPRIRSPMRYPLRHKGR